MSPLTAKLKCPHGTGEDTNGAEAVTEVASDEDGGGREDHLEGGRGKIDVSYRQVKLVCCLRNKLNKLCRFLANPTI